MRPRSFLTAAFLVILAGCGGTAGGPTPAGPAGQGAAAEPTVSIEIGEGEPLAAPADPAPSTLVVAVEGDDSAAAAPPSGSDSAAPGPSPATAPVGTGPPLAFPAGASASSVVAQAVAPRVTARIAPSDDAAPVAALDHPTAVGSPLVFLAVDTTSTPGWLQVQLPVEPNGTTGWVRRDDVTLFENPYRIEIERSSHRLQVFHLG